MVRAHFERAAHQIGLVKEQGIERAVYQQRGSELLSIAATAEPPRGPEPLRLTIGVNRRYRSGALRGDEKSERLAVKVTRRGSVRVERLVRRRRGIDR